MALYADDRFLTKIPDMRDFQVTTAGGELTPISGIYRCEECGWEIVIDAGQNGRRLPKKHFPNQTHDDPIQWRLIVTDSGTLDVAHGDSLITEIPSNGKGVDKGSRPRR